MSLSEGTLYHQKRWLEHKKMVWLIMDLLAKNVCNSEETLDLLSHLVHDFPNLINKGGVAWQITFG